MEEEEGAYQASAYGGDDDDVCVSQMTKHKTQPEAKVVGWVHFNSLGLVGVTMAHINITFQKMKV